MEYAVNRLIDSVWTIQYTHNPDGTVTIHGYDRDNAIGYEQEDTLCRARLIEGDGRIVQELIVLQEPGRGFDRDLKNQPHSRFKVANPKHVFNYS
jgi:hypothetical protein